MSRSFNTGSSTAAISGDELNDLTPAPLSVNGRHLNSRTHPPTRSLARSLGQLGMG